MERRRVVLLCSLVATVAFAKRSDSNQSRVALLEKLANRPPVGIDPNFECDWRNLAYTWAQQLQPFRSAASFRSVFDGLELGTLCNKSFAIVPAVDVPAPLRLASGATELYVDYGKGDDGNSGAVGSPLKHLQFAVNRSRSLPKPVNIILRDGVHRLDQTLVLGAADSQLTITNFAGESPIVSSGVVLKTTWNPHNVSTPSKPEAPQYLVYNNSNNMYGQWPHPNIFNLSVSRTWQDCESKCAAYTPNCTSFVWYDPSDYGLPWGTMCFLRTDQPVVWAPTEQNGVVSGYQPAPPLPQNVWVADLAAGGTPLPSYVTSTDDFVMTMLVSPDGGRNVERVFRARYPNANLEIDLFPKGWASGGKRISSPPDQKTNVTTVPLPSNYGPAEFSDYYWGTGGPCDRFKTVPLGSYWCQPKGRVAGATYFVNSPTGLIATAAQLPHAPYTSNPAGNGAVLQYWRSGHWFSMMVRISNATHNASDGSTALSWTYGAFQGAEGDASGEDWYIDHVMEELDSPREFYFDAGAQKFYYFHNATSGTPPPPSWTFEVPMLTTLISVEGTQSAPTRDISISGITFTSARASFLGSHGIPSGGDWGLARIAAIQLEGSENVTISNCLFSRLDGNAIFLSGYNRNATIDRNEFVWLGESAVASWGYNNGVDGTLGDQPWYTKVTNNLCHEIGHFEKQVSCYFGATSPLAEVSGNIMFNMPRAAVNWNDGFGGGNVMHHNLIWNTCRESQDHGPFNSWDRVPYLTTVRNGTASPIMADNEIHTNFMVAGGGADGGAIDNDDGSSFYAIHDNFFAYGGHKSDFDGHAKRSYNNVMAYAYTYGSKCVGIMNLPFSDPKAFWAEGFMNNTCVLANAGDTYLDMGDCAVTDATLPRRMLLGGNRIFAPNADVAVTCGKKYTFAEWMSYGFDAGTTVSGAPSSATMMSWARALLGIQGN